VENLGHLGPMVSETTKTLDLNCDCGKFRAFGHPPHLSSLFCVEFACVER